MKLPPDHQRMVSEAAAQVRAAKERGENHITLDTPSAWTLGEDAWETNVIAELGRTGIVEREFTQ